MRPLLRLLAFVRPYWRRTAGAYLCVLGTSAVTLVVPALLGLAVDRGIGQRDVGFLFQVGAAILAASAARGLLAFGQGYLAESAAQSASYSLRKAIYAQIQRLSFSFHDRAQTGELMARATADVEAVRHLSGRGLVQIVNLALLLLGVVGALLYMNALLAALSLAVLPLLVWRTERFGRRIRPMYLAVQNELAALSALIQENVSGVRVVKAFGREADEIRRFDAQNSRHYERSLAAAREAALNPPLLDFLASVSTLAMLWLGGVLVMAGHLTLGELVAFYSYLLQLAMPIRRGGWLMSTASRAAAAAERIFEVLDTPVVVQDLPGARELPPLRGLVEFLDVSCAYHPGRPVLEHVSFRIEPGQTVALVGATGSGKTSIANLVPRFYDVSAGRVLIDGHDVREVQLQSLRRQIGVVFQETLLFSGTVRENISFGRPEASDEQVRAAARWARADEFIARLPRAYDTLVGERGVSLSGGQKQRIAIARALLLDPRILVLDEFTSSVDVQTEQVIRAAMRELLRGRTTVIIAQRLSTVRAADLILVVERGRLIAQGSHEHLLRASAEYRGLCAAQLAPEETAEVPVGDGRAAAGADSSGLRVPGSEYGPPGTRNSELGARNRASRGRG